jgi:hypothetical protein
MADDTAPHLNGLPLSHPDVQALQAECMKALRAGRRAEGGRKAAETRAANAAKGISQVGLKGSARQKQWVAQIRGAMQRAAGDDAGFAAVLEGAHQAAFWIDNRKVSWADLSARFAKAKARNDAAVAEVRSILLGASRIELEQSRRCDELVKIQGEFDRFLRR